MTESASARKVRIERWAAACAAEATSAVDVISRDFGGRQMRDFDLLFADEHQEPLEVTMDADPAIMQARARLERYGTELEADIARLWLVTISYIRDGPAGREAYDVRRCHRELPAIVERLERAGLTEFDTAYLRWQQPFQEDAVRLVALGVDRGASCAPTADDEPRVLLLPSSGAIINPDDITSAVERAAADEGNQAKLAARPEAPRRHLFVVLSGATTEFATVALLNVLEGKQKPPRVPSLPAAVTTAWAGSAGGVLVVTPPDEWESFYPSDRTRELLTLEGIV